MPVVVLLAVFVAFAVLLVRLNDGRGSGDLPARIVTTATNRLPADRRAWGQAMAAELASVTGHTKRWRFAVGVARVAMFPPLRHRRRVLAVAGTGFVAAAALTVVAAVETPGLSVSAGALGVLLCGYAVVVASRSRPPTLSAVRVSVVVVAVAGLGTTVAAIVGVGVTHPTATVDHTPGHLVSILFALLVTGYVALVLTPPRLGDHADRALWWALSGAVAAGAIWTGVAITTPTEVDALQPAVEPIAAMAALATSVGAAVTTRSLAAGVRAGLFTAILAAPIYVAVDLTHFLHLPAYTLPTSYDAIAYPRSGYPDVASYLLSDRIGGDIMTLVIYPIVMLTLAVLGAAAATALRRTSVTPAGEVG